MTHKVWHLDIGFDDVLFQRNWDSESHELLLKLFSYLDLAKKPVLSMLPPSVSPAGAAAAAALYFLPGIEHPPKPHCRIALFPGLHFVSQLRKVSFDTEALWKASQKSRASLRGYCGVVGSFDKLRLRLSEADPVAFHWIFRCQRTWTRNWIKEHAELLPRSIYGKNDPYSAVVDIIESDHLDFFSNSLDPYDLLIYCPYFHSRSSNQSEQDLDLLVNKIESFSAHRKLIVARSPFDYWSRRLEIKLHTCGIAINSSGANDNSNSMGKNEIKFFIVDQYINLKEAQILFHELGLVARKHGIDRTLIYEIKGLLRRLLISIDPTTMEDEGAPEDLSQKLIKLAASLEFNKDGPAWGVLQKICSAQSSANENTKIRKIRELILGGSYEIWVTKDRDRQRLIDFKQEHDLDLSIRLVDRWTAPGARDSGRNVILSRIDREGDLDLTAYLQANDAIIMSTWEAVLRKATIMVSWERSERWRENAKSLKINVTTTKDKKIDSVLELANFLLSTEVYKAPENPLKEPVAVEEVSVSWWDEYETGSILETLHARSDLMMNQGGKTYACRELILDENFGMFVRFDDEIQVLDEDASDGDIFAVSVKDLTPGKTIILFKDSERNSIFDILMDQLERSPEFQNDARIVRKWKHDLRQHVITKALRISSIQANLEKRGQYFDLVTVKSWIFGPTMAPRRLENIALLIEVLKLDGTNPGQLFQSVTNLRSIARTLGRALNQLIRQKNADKLERHIRSALVDAGIDLNELSSAIETRILTDISQQLFNVESRSIGKLFPVNHT